MDNSLISSKVEGAVLVVLGARYSATCWWELVSLKLNVFWLFLQKVCISDGGNEKL